MRSPLWIHPCIGKITLSAKGITDEITDNHPIDICSAVLADFVFGPIHLLVTMVLRFGKEKKKRYEIP